MCVSPYTRCAIYLKLAREISQIAWHFHLSVDAFTHMGISIMSKSQGWGDRLKCTTFTKISISIHAISLGTAKNQFLYEFSVLIITLLL